MSLHAYLGEMKRCDCDAAVMEVSSHAIDMKRVSALLFDVVLFTNLSHDPWIIMQIWRIIFA